MKNTPKMPTLTCPLPQPDGCACGDNLTVNDQEFGPQRYYCHRCKTYFELEHDYVARRGHATHVLCLMLREV